MHPDQQARLAAVMVEELKEAVNQGPELDGNHLHPLYFFVYLLRSSPNKTFISRYWAMNSPIL